ncbi:hypothetical protein LTS18_008895 [Coniosporium uncinatum]|uniref:Uncharacterized protein n=1 Tax=Coniosporium uncinatum TaxID=93489 RepID=A0ACC3DMK8_9PEZI|nr:hypothetical protein LTS18_008895 [Coniosporium uncinatum]
MQTEFSASGSQSWTAAKSPLFDPSALSPDQRREACPICFETLKHHGVLTKTVCGHIYGEACIWRWFNVYAPAKEHRTTCPTCRRELVTTEKEEVRRWSTEG